MRGHNRPFASGSNFLALCSMSMLSQNIIQNQWVLKHRVKELRDELKPLILEFLLLVIITEIDHKAFLAIGTQHHLQQAAHMNMRRGWGGAPTLVDICSHLGMGESN